MVYINKNHTQYRGNANKNCYPKKQGEKNMKKTIFKKIMSIVLTVLILTVSLSCVASAAGSTDSVSMNGVGVYELFNSGCTNSWGSGNISTTINPETYDNNGYDIYLTNDGLIEAQLGQSFNVKTNLSDNAVITISAFDVDEESGERDIVYLVDETTGESTAVGRLSGMDEEWNTTSIVVDADLFEKNHTYHFYLVDSVEGWVVWVRTVTLVIGNAFDIEASLDSTIDDDTAVVSNKVKIAASSNGEYVYEFKAVNADNGNQYGSLFENVEVGKIAKTNTYEFTLISDAPAGEYNVYLYIKSASTGAVVLVLEDTVYYQVEGPAEEMNFFQRIWNFFLQIFVFLGLS